MNRRKWYIMDCKNIGKTRNMRRCKSQPGFKVGKNIKGAGNYGRHFVTWI